ncbi:MAG: carbohydrate-binding domain-containing protein [Oscillospiraceae bacterium]|jgi:hypothetical protein|nr:carbohydrate-binding domain-containing protein [Oscillospiraceae bacterium]
MKKLISLLIIGALIFGLAGCGKQSSASDTTSTPNESASDNNGASSDSSVSNPPVAPVSVSNDDKDSSWNEATATKIVLGDSISVNGSGVTVKGNVVTVTTAGTYVVSGTTANGQIVVDAATKDEVQLVLNGAQITNKSGAAIYAPQCDNLKVTLAAGTQNTLADGGSAFVYTDTANEEPNAALFSKDSLTINGTGTLTVTAGFNNGIGTKDNLVIVSGSIVVHAANHGIRGNDSVAILGGNFNITAGNDGIQTSNAEESGTIDIADGTFKIVAVHDGIQSENGLLIAGGVFDIKSGGDTTGATDTSDSYKGLKAAGDMDISAGTFVINGADDTIHSNGNITIRGGDFTLSSGDDGIHADNALTISGGSINVTKSYEGLEGTNVSISSGTIVVHSTDDGINAAGGTNANVGGGRYGNDHFAAGSSVGITISGGVITLYTTSDGIDANGTLTVTGGTIAVFIGATRDGDATDVDNGGTIRPALYGTANLSAGAKMAVGDLWSLTLESNVTSYCLMIPGVVNGQSYKITVNGTALATVTATTTIQGMMGGRNAGGMGGSKGGGRR